MNNANSFDELLPKGFSEFINQSKAKAILKDAILSSVKRDIPIEHVLLSGLAGCGKTTMALLIAKERKVHIELTTGGSLEKAEDIYELFKKIKDKKHPIIFIDEVHGIKKSLAEILYLPMEHPDVEISIPTTKKSNNGGFGLCWNKEQENTKIKVSPFTLIGATAGEQGELEKPFRDRFGLHIQLEKYTMDNMEMLIAQSYKKLEMNLSKNIIKAVAQRSCYTPRKANSLLKRIREHADAVNCKKPNIKMVEKVFKRLGIDYLGIDEIGRQILMALYKSPKGALGLISISKIVQASISTINNVYEPSLLQRELITYLPRGRAITQKGIDHLKKLGLISS